MTKLTRRQHILQFLREHPESSPSAIAEAVGIRPRLCGVYLLKMRKKGDVTHHGYGSYSVAEQANKPKEKTPREEAERPKQQERPGSNTIAYEDLLTLFNLRKKYTRERLVRILQEMG